MVGALTFCALAGAGLVAATPSNAAAYPSSSVTVSGHGYGHGIGMGQWGALGYATGQDDGQGTWTWQRIVEHYYSPAILQQSADDAQSVKIALTENNGLNVIVYSPSGVTGPGVSGAPAAVYYQQNGSTWTAQQGPGCAGPWSPGVPVANDPVVSPAGAQLLQLCLAGGNLTVHGSIEATYAATSPPSSRSVNIVPLSQYLDDVVPSESSAGWGSLGPPNGPDQNPWGFQALEAQAVAARSYVLSTPGGYGIGGYADTCDQTCQSYPGTRNEGALTDQAVLDTVGWVMQFPGAAHPASTEYSASTGGYTASTAEQSPFTPVPDAGDAVCIPGSGYSCNPNHNWQASIPVASIEAAYPQIGSLSSIAVTATNNLPSQGQGRVISMVIAGSSGSMTVNGSQFAATFNLLSDWFSITSNPSGGVGGYLLAAADGGVFAFGNAAFHGSMGGRPLNQPIVGMTQTAGDTGYWEVASDGGIFSFDAPFSGSMGGRPLNQPIVGMAADPATGGYWEVASDGGIFAFNAPFYGSMGGRPLNQPIVGMAAAPGGTGYWLVASDGGIFSFGTGATFYGSTGSIHLVRPIVGMAVAPGGTGYWLSAADGGVFTFGPGANFFGSDAGQANVAGTVGLLATATGAGYLDVTGAGQITNFGDAPQFGDLTTVLSGYGGHVVAAATTPG